MKTSSAIRVSEILKRAAGVPDGGNVQEALAKVLGPFNALADAAARQDAVSEVIAALRSEIRGVDAQLRAEGVPDELRDPPIHAALELTGPLTLSASWQTHRTNHLRNDVVVAWKWIAIYLPAHDDQVTPEVLSELAEDVEELEAAACADGVPEELRAFTLRQARAIRAALNRYQVAGAEPFRAAMSAGIGDLVREAPALEGVDFEKPASQGAFDKLRKTWNAVAKVTGDINKMHDFYKKISVAVPALKLLVVEVTKRLVQ